jgi:hypothetical protein
VTGRASKHRWEAYFPIEDADRPLLVQWLKEPDRIRKTCTVEEATKGFMIVSSDKDEVFQIAEFVRNANPLGRKLFYTVRGYDRKGHKLLDTAWRSEFAERPRVLLDIVTVRNRKVPIPREIRVRLNMADGDKLALFVDDRRRILLVPSSQVGLAK